MLVSAAKSASRICELLDERFSKADCKLRTLVCRTFRSNAPRRPRSVEMSSMALSRMALAWVKSPLATLSAME